MNNRGFKNILNTIVFLLFASALFSRCATTMTPSGGPKDTLAPVIVELNPDNYTTNFDEKKIYIVFDEFVQLKDQQKEFFTSPQMKKKPTLSLRGKGVVVTIKDTLKENTTYALNFGSSIRDNNEGNPLNSMRYVFSTGDKVDSMLLSGYTADSYKADSVSKSYIYFYEQDSLDMTAEYDSTLFNRKPSAIARAEGNGIFIAQNLKPVPYNIYAIEDKNDNQMYEPGSDQVGFLEDSYNPIEQPDFSVWYDSLRHYVVADPQVYIRMFTDEAFKRQILQQSERPLQHKAMLYFGASSPKIEKIRFDSIPEDKFIVERITSDNDTLAIWFNMPPEQLPDTIRGEVTYFKHDSIRQLVPSTDKLALSWKFFETKEQEKARKEKEKQLEKEKEQAEKDSIEWVAPKEPSLFKTTASLNGKINPEQGLTLDFEYPITKMDTLAITLTSTKSAEKPKSGGKQAAPQDKEASAAEEVSESYTLERDTMNFRRWYLNAKWDKVDSKYKLTIPEGALTNVAGYVNDTIVGNYTVLNQDDFSKVIISMKRAADDNSKYIIQLLNGSNKLLEQKKDLTGGTVTFNYVPAGDIRIRVVQDMNGNGKWDTGSLVEKRQPERSELYSKDGEDTFATKVQWEIEMEIDMAEMFAPVTMQSLIKTLDDRETQRIKDYEIEQQKKRAEAAKKLQQSQNQGSGGFNMNQMTQGLGGL